VVTAHQLPARVGRVGRVVILNGAPRSGKSSIVAAMQAMSDEPWMNLGVDVFMRATPSSLLPGIGLRPGGERPDLEPFVLTLYGAMYDAIIAHSRSGLNVVVDVGHHDNYSTSLGVLPTVARRLADIPTLMVGVRCPIDVIMQRRDDGRRADGGVAGGYETTRPDGEVPEAVVRWQRDVHDPGFYDLEVDTASMTPDMCAQAVFDRLAAGGPFAAIVRLAALATAQRD
jgi:chloramphenicol 3-O phosphotransferase